MQASSRINNRKAWTDAITSVASLFAALWLHMESKLAAAEAMQRYGRNVDSGVYEAMAANWYFIPVSVALGIAAIAMFRSWPYCRLLHWLAWLLVAVPLTWLAVSEVMLRVAA